MSTIPRDAYHALILRRAALLYVALLLLVLSGCATYIDPNNRVPDWPPLVEDVRVVPNAVMRDNCGKYTPWWGSPMACTDFDFDKLLCVTWLSADFPMASITVHEHMHCLGYDHYGSNAMAAELADWKRRAK